MTYTTSDHQDWSILYNIFKGPDWPDCPPEEDFYLLPEWIQQELTSVFGYAPIVDNTKKFLCDGDLPITVFYTDDLDGGGTTFGQDYIPKIKIKYPDKKFSKIFEWCSGPGFIGFSLLSHGVCDKLCLNDLYNPAIELVDRTINYQDNNCSNLVSAYLLKDINLLPAYEMFDLVVSNPPHFVKNISRIGNTNRLCSDIKWESHKNFFNNIKSHLMPDGIILLQENYQGSTPDDFKSFIDDAGLQITDCFDSVGTYYFLEIKLK
jgi:hypothetical protein